VVELGIPVLNSNGNSFCEDDNPTIAALSANIQGNINIVWFNAAVNGSSYATTDLLQDGATYYASFVTASGCESPTRLEVTVDLTVCDNILIPDGFSPNGDGINDEFVIENLPIVYPNFGLEIYNRYGNLLYKGNNNNQNWNGTTSENGFNLGSNLLPTGVYFYILNFNDGVRKPVQGRVYLSR
jgi:gliding motility-associated-like protein